MPRSAKVIGWSALGVFYFLCPMLSHGANFEKDKDIYRVSISSVQAENDYREYMVVKAPAEKGDAAAENKLAIMYRDGRGVYQDFSQALSWFRRSADQHYPKALLNLGLMYGNGLGVPRSYEEEMKWIRQAAEAGDAEAQYDLGVMIAEGRRKEGYEEEAASWIKKAAEQNFSPAERNLGERYARGRGLTRDDEKAYFWLSLAEIQGEPTGVLLKKVAKKLSEPQIEKIDKEVKARAPKVEEQERRDSTVVKPLNETLPAY